MFRLCDLGTDLLYQKPSYQYRDLWRYCRDMAILWPSDLHNGISYIGRMVLLYWIKTQHSRIWYYAVYPINKLCFYCGCAIAPHWINVTSSDNEVTLKTFRPKQNGRHFADDSFLNKDGFILINISLKFVPWIQQNNRLRVATVREKSGKFQSLSESGKSQNFVASYGIL